MEQPLPDCAGAWMTISCRRWANAPSPTSRLWTSWMLFVRSKNAMSWKWQSVLSRWPGPFLDRRADRSAPLHRRILTWRTAMPESRRHSWIGLARLWANSEEREGSDATQRLNRYGSGAASKLSKEA